jgi:putative endonuclease
MKFFIGIFLYVSGVDRRHLIRFLDNLVNDNSRFEVMCMVTVYLLECGDGSLYAGVAVDFGKRLAQHQAGKGAKYTRGRGPLLVRYLEAQPDKGSALRREIEIKRMTRARKERLIASVCLLPPYDGSEAAQT